MNLLKQSVRNSKRENTYATQVFVGLRTTIKESVRMHSQQLDFQALQTFQLPLPRTSRTMKVRNIFWFCLTRFNVPTGARESSLIVYREQFWRAWGESAGSVWAAGCSPVKQYLSWPTFYSTCFNFPLWTTICILIKKLLLRWENTCFSGMCWPQCVPLC